MNVSIAALEEILKAQKERNKLVIVTHTGIRHVDEVDAIRRLQKYGEKIFPGIGEARIIFLNAGHNRDIKDKKAEELIRKGIIPVDIGGGPFDHPIHKKGCATTQVAECFNIRTPAEREMTDYVFASDIYGKSTPFDLARTFKFVSMALEDGRPIKSLESDKAIMEWALKISEAILEHMSKFDPRGKERLKINRYLTDIVVSAWLAERFRLGKRNNLSEVVEKVENIGTVEFSEENCRTVKAIGMIEQNQRSVLERLERFIFNNFVKGNRTKFDLSEITSCLYFYYGGDIRRTMEEVFKALDGFLWREMAYQEARSEYEKKAIEQIIKDHRGRNIKVATIESNNLMMAIFARAEKKVVLLVQRNENRGRKTIYISANKKRVRKAEIADIVALLRIKEQEARNVPINKQVYDWNVLRREGTLGEIPQWHYQEEAWAIFNRSLSAKDVPSTALSLDEIHGCVSIAIDHSYMPGCNSGKDGCIKDKCPIYKAGFVRCRTKRHNDYQKASKKEKVRKETW